MLPSVTTILSDEGVGFDMSHLPHHYAERGTLVHLYAENRMKGCELPEVPDEWRGYTDGVDSFQDELEIYPMKHKGEYLMETTLTHPMGFQGHPDLPAIFKMATIFDYKTGSVPEYTGPQLSGYELLLRALLPHIEEWARIAVLLPGDGTFKLEPYKSCRDMATFVTAYKNYLKRRGVEWIF